MPATTGLFKVVQGSFGETLGIQCACMTLFAMSYSTINEISRWDQFDFDFVLMNRDALYKTLG